MVRLLKLVRYIRVQAGNGEVQLLEMFVLHYQ